MPPPAELRNRPEDGNSWVQKVKVAEIFLRWLLGCFWGMWAYIGGRSTSVAARGAQETGGAPRGARRALHPRGPPVAPPMYSFLLYIPTYPQAIRYGAKTLIPPSQLSVSMRSHLGACSGAPPEGASITEGFYIIIQAPPMKCE